VSYLVLARKHRPANFAQVVGQEHITQTLAGALTSGRLAHAFCFTGPRGVGKTSVARILAKALNCEQGPTPAPCGGCVHCQEIDHGRAVDVQEIDAASSSRVEDVRDLRETIRYRPQAARYRVTILDEVHMLSKAAFNALLKTLEEPPAHAVFILATTDMHKVPLTILSRCQRYDFRRLAPKVLAGHLKSVLDVEGLALPAESLALMAREADGSIRDALSLLDQVLSSGRPQLTHAEVVELLGLVDRELVSAAAAAVLAAEPAKVLDLVAKVYSAGGEMQAFYSAMQERFRNLAAAKVAPPGVELFGLTEEELKGLKAQAQGVSAEALHEIFDLLASSEELFRRSGHPRLVMEMTLLKLTQVKPVLSLTEIIERLSRAAGGQGSGGVGPAVSGPSPESPFQASELAAASSQIPRLVKEMPPPSGGPLPQTVFQPNEQSLRELSRYAARVEPALASYLRRASLQTSEEGWLITLPYSPLAVDLAGAEAKLNSLAGELWREAPRLRLLAAPPAEVSTEAGRREIDRAASLAEHPAVMEAVEVFEAQVVALNPLRME
jgi:DNA polymerase-3 subunit gamma/tau